MMMRDDLAEVAMTTEEEEEEARGINVCVVKG